MGVDARMLVKLAVPMTDAEIIDASYRLSEAMGHSSHVFWLSDDNDVAKGEKRRALNRVLNNDEGDYRACGIADFSGLWLWVSLWGRYYGDGYERGDVWAFIAIAEWCERNFISCTVYYGGDSGDSLDIFGKFSREELISHWAEVGGRPYYAREGKTGFLARETDSKTPICPLCEHLATQYGSGGCFASWSCDACHRHWVWVGADVRAYPPSQDFDSFKASDAQRAELTAKA